MIRFTVSYIYVIFTFVVTSCYCSYLQTTVNILLISSFLSKIVCTLGILYYQTALLWREIFIFRRRLSVCLFCKEALSATIICIFYRRRHLPAEFFVEAGINKRGRSSVVIDGSMPRGVLLMPGFCLLLYHTC